MALLRWREVIRDLQQSAAMGAFGRNLRLYEQADGSLQLVESVPRGGLGQDRRIEGNKLYPNAGVFEDVPVIPGDGSVELNQIEMTGPTIGYVYASRASALDPWGAASFILTSVPPESSTDDLEYLRLLVFIRLGEVLPLEN